MGHSEKYSPGLVGGVAVHGWSGKSSQSGTKTVADLMETDDI